MQSNVNVLSIAFFFVFMGLTLFITYWAGEAYQHHRALFRCRRADHGLAEWLGACRGFSVGRRAAGDRRHHHLERF